MGIAARHARAIHTRAQSCTREAMVVAEEVERETVASVCLSRASKIGHANEIRPRNMEGLEARATQYVKAPQIR